jgi:hypothetical protein
MNARFLHPSARRNSTAAEAAPAVPAAPPAEYADCCPAKAVVRVTMAQPADSHLLLCGHHYRASRDALAAARAAVHELPGLPGDVAAWIGLDRRAVPAPA